MALEERVEFGTASQMITADSDFSLDEKKELKRVDLACGQSKKSGYIGIDRIAETNVDIVHDLNKFPWPFEDNSVYEFFCSHYVEHCPDLVRFMEEVYRCLMPDGTIEIFAPFYTSVRAWQDPTHVRGITDITFLYFSQEKSKEMKVDHYTGKCNFEVVARKFILNDEWASRSLEAQQWAARHYVNVVDDIYFLLRKKPIIDSIDNEAIVR